MKRNKRTYYRPKQCVEKWLAGEYSNQVWYARPIKTSIKHKTQSVSSEQ